MYTSIHLPLAILLILTACCTFGQDRDPRLDDGIAYKVRVEGTSRSLRNRLKELMKSIELRDHPPPTVGLLQRRAEEDLDTLRRGLRAFGYYAGTVELVVESDRRPAILRYTVVPGEPFRIRTVEIEYEGEGELPGKPGKPAVIGLPIDDIFETKLIPTAETKLLEWLRQRGYPRPRMHDRAIRIEHSDQSVHIRLVAVPGSLASFGEVTIEGLNRVESSYVKKLITWEEGDRFSSIRLSELRSELTSSNLFQAIQIHTELPDDAPETVNVKLELDERKPRTVRTGIGYSSDIGAYLRLGWEHRNFSGEAETLRLSTLFAERQLEGVIEFRKPMWRRNDQDLLLRLRVHSEDFDAYSSEGGRVSAEVERRLTSRWTLGMGLALRYAEVDAADTKDSFTLFSIPMGLTYDSSNSVLDPTSGLYANLFAAPTVDIFDNSIHYLRSRTDWRAYLPLTAEDRLVLASRVSLGSIQGANHQDVPADERFYAGGGGSVRGYDFQSLAPHVAGENVGGLSLVEGSVELRWRISQRFGVTTFLDGGNAYAERYPNFDRSLRWGTGFGIRYHTPIGPIRLDLGVPINPHDGDHDLHLYISIGQAF